MAFTCFESEIRNITDKKMTLSMVNGVELAPGASTTVEGDVSGWLAGKFPGIKGVRMIRKLSDLVDAKKLTISVLPTAPCGALQAGISSSSSMKP